MLDTKTTFDDLVTRYAGDPGPGRAHPRQPPVPQHLRRPVGHAGVHGDGEAVRAARGGPLRPHRRRHAADPQRPRLPRRAPAPDPLPRQPHLPAADDADARLPEGGQRRHAGVPRTVAKVVGAEVVGDAVAFFQAFEGMEEGFRDRAQRVLDLLSEPSTAFVLVASPRRDAVDEAMFFADKLRRRASTSTRWSSTGCTPASAGQRQRQRRRRPGPGRLTGRHPLGRSTPTWPTSARWRSARRATSPSWRPRWRPRPSPACPSWPPTSTTSTG